MIQKIKLFSDKDIEPSVLISVNRCIKQFSYCAKEPERNRDDFSAAGSDLLQAMLEKVMDAVKT